MASDKPQMTLGDLVTMAVSPVLIMALVGSLVFFLLEILYVGQFEARLHWTLFFFVFAAVLIARIAIEQPGGTAGIYGLALGAVVFFSLQSYVQYAPAGPLAGFDWAINLGLMALIWWCAHRLTFDCTHIDDNVEASGKGVLDAAGLEERPADEDDANPAVSVDEEDQVPQDPKAPKGVLGWWERYRNYREREAKKPHTPGVWVVYFSLAALPLFGLGQSLIPPEKVERRQYVFWLMVIYVASGMGLLATTCYLGLRRYLRQRKLKMPVAMTSTWLILGGGLIGAMLLVGALLPRPYAEYQLVSLPGAGSKARDASSNSILRDSAGKKEGKASNDSDRDDADAKDGEGEKEGGEKGDKTKDGKSGSGKKGKKDGGSAKGKGKKGDSGNKDPDSGKSTSSTPPRFSLMEHLGTFGQILKWIVFAVLLLIVAFFVFRSGLRWLAGFTLWARNLWNALANWWNGLFGWVQTGESEINFQPDEPVRRPRPFAAFSNPFRDGRAEREGPEETVRYSFGALQAWAFEHDLGRDPQDTPLEFMYRVGDKVPELENSGRRLLGLYLHVAYARTRLKPASLKIVEEFWESLEGAALVPAEPEGVLDGPKEA